MKLFTNFLFVFGAILLLVFVGWYLFGRTLIVEAPVHEANTDDSEEPLNPISVNNFEDCTAAGNPVMESYPRQCRHEGVLYVEEIATPVEQQGNDEIVCSPESKLAEACTMEYAPVCGLVQVQCITTPCDPIPETFSNGCMACAQGNVVSYTEGACSLEV